MQSNAARTVALKLDLDRFLPYRLSVLSNTVSSAIAREYSDRFGLSIPEWRVMAVLGGEPKLSARDVTERTAMDKVQVSRAVESLVRAQRVARTADPADGRIARLSLTAKGRAIYDEVNGAGAFTAMLASVPEPSSALLATFGLLILHPAGRSLWRRRFHLSRPLE